MDNFPQNMSLDVQGVVDIDFQVEFVVFFSLPGLIESETQRVQVDQTLSIGKIGNPLHRSS